MTDFYLFKTRTPSHVALIANVAGLIQSQAGPNYNPLNDDYVYQIHIDNDGDAYEDLTLQFIPGSRMVNNGRGIEVPVQGRQVPIALQTAGPVFNATSKKVSNLNTEEYYRVRVLNGYDYSTPIEDGPFAFRYTDATKTTVTREFTKAFDNAGTKTFPGGATGYDNYEAYVKSAATYTDVRIPGCLFDAKLFVGPRRESFGIALGEVFDLVNIDTKPITIGTTTLDNVPLSGAARDNANANARNANSIDRFSVISFVVEIHESCLVNKFNGRVLGAWASTRKIEHKNDKHYTGQQTSRLGNPLVNELLIGTAYKNEWNSRHPSGDARYNEFLLFPSLPVILNALFGVTAPNFARQDLLAVFHTGLPGINKPVNHATTTDSESDKKTVYADLLRLNLDSPYVSCPAQKSLGAIAEPAGAGFPNGRRLGDDVVDIALNAVQGILCTLKNGALCPGATLDATGKPVGSFVGTNLFTDLVPTKACDFKCVADDFPFLNPPIPGNKLFTIDPIYLPSQAQLGTAKGAACI